jgi:hypothetical protein
MNPLEISQGQFELLANRVTSMAADYYARLPCQPTRAYQER